MANYNVDIAVALKGAQKLTSFNREVKATTTNINAFEKQLKSAAKDQTLLVRNFNNLNEVLTRATKNFNAVASGTNMQKKAARELVAAERELNKEYQQRERLLQSIRSNQSGFAQFSRSASKVSSPNVFDTATQKSIDRNRRRQNRILGITSTPFGPQPMVNQPFEAVSLTSPQAIRDRIINRRATNFARTGTASSFPRSEGFLAFNQTAKKIEAGVKGIGKSSSQTARVLSSQAASAAFQDLPFGVKGGQIGPAQSNLFNRLGFGRNASPRGPFAMQGGSSARIKSSLQSGLIGGGFPLLFGGGGAGAVAGGLGGLAGGALSAGGGFALSIAATALVSQIQEVRKFRKAVNELNRDLLASGAATQVSRKQIKELGKALNITKEEAIETLAEFNKFADSGFVNLAELFGTRELFDATVGLNDFESTLQRIQTLSEKLTLETEFKAYEILSTKGAESASEFIKNQFLIRQQFDRFNTSYKDDLKTFENLGVAGFKTDMGFSSAKRAFFSDSYNKDFAEILKFYIDSNEEIQAIMKDPASYIKSDPNILTGKAIREIDNILKPFLKDSDKVKQFLQELPEDFDVSTESAKNLVDRLSETQEKLQFLQEFKAPEEEIRKLLNPMRQVLDLSNEIKIGFEDSFKGIIKGTMSVQDAFRSMLNRIADYFLDFAARLLALQVQKGFLSLFSSMFTIGEVGETGLTSGDRMLGSRSGGRRANGGIVDAGKSYMVGERGVEMFVPNAGGRIVPNSDLGGSTNIVVNVDASGSSVEGDEEQSRELGRIISVAIQSELIKQKRPGGMLA